MKKIALAVTMLFPYIFCFFTYIIFKFINSEPTNYWVFLIMTIIMMILFMALYINILFCIVVKWEPRKSLFISLLMKISHVPIQCALIVLGLGCLNPFLLVIAWIPFLISAGINGITGTVFTVSQGRVFLRTRKKLIKTLIYCFLSYCYVLDIIVAILAYVEIRKTEKELLIKE